MTQEHAFCKNCGTEYTADKITSAFCSGKCRREYRNFDDTRYEAVYQTWDKCNICDSYITEFRLLGENMHNHCQCCRGTEYCVIGEKS